MRAAGVETTVNSDDLAIMGIVEVGRVFPRFIKAFRKLRDAAIQKSPDAVILVDWPEFNLRLAAALHRRGLKVIYYISPQLWAWRPGRVSKIKENVDLLLSILPFEVDWYKAHGVDHVEFVGHPLSGEVKARFEREEFCRRNDLDPARPIISFLPGSRQKEVGTNSAADARCDRRAAEGASRGAGRGCGRTEPERAGDVRADVVAQPIGYWYGGPTTNTRGARGFGSRGSREWYGNARSSTARNTDGCCLQRVVCELAHAWATDHCATFRVGKSCGG